MNCLFSPRQKPKQITHYTHKTPKTNKQKPTTSLLNSQAIISVPNDHKSTNLDQRIISTCQSVSREPSSTVIKNPGLCITHWEQTPDRHTLFSNTLAPAQLYQQARGLYQLRSFPSSGVQPCSQLSLGEPPRDPVQTQGKLARGKEGTTFSQSHSPDQFTIRTRVNSLNTDYTSTQFYRQLNN